MNMENLYHQTNQLIQETSELFIKLEKNPDSVDIEDAIQSRINSVNANCEKLDIMVFKTPLNQRSMAKMRVDQLKYDNKHIQASLINAQNKRRRREQEREEREQLLSRRFGHDHTVTVDFMAQEQVSLQNSHRNVDEMLHTGSNILETLRYNRETLKGAHRRLIDLANTLGLSNATISLIERRVAQDKYVLFGGMFVTLAVIALVIIYLLRISINCF